MNQLTDKKRADIVKGYNKVLGLLKKRSSNRPRFTLQKGFYQWLAFSKTKKTKSVVEKFYFNSTLNSIKTLWLFRTMYHRDLEKKRVRPEAIVFIESIVKIVELMKIKTTRQSFSRFYGQEGLVKRFRYIAETCKRLQSFKLKEFTTNYRSKIQTKRVVDGVFLLQKYQDKVVYSSFATLLGRIRNDKKDRQQRTSAIVSRLSQASRMKKASVLKTLSKFAHRYRESESFFSRIDTIIKNRSVRSKRESLVNILIHANVKSKITASKNASTNLALRKLDQFFQRQKTKMLSQTTHKLRYELLYKFKRVREIVNTIKKNYFIKSTTAFHGLRAILKRRNNRAQQVSLIALASLFKSKMKQAFEKVRQSAEANLYESHYNNLMRTKHEFEAKEAAMQSIKTKASLKEYSLRNFCKVYETLVNSRLLKEKIFFFSKLKVGLKKRKIMIHKTRDEQVVKNTIIMTNLLKALLKKQLMTKFMHFKVWQRYTAFLGKYHITGINARSFFEILQGKVTKKIALTSDLTFTNNLQKLAMLFTRMAAKRKGHFFKQCKFYLTDKSWNLYLALALLTRNIMHRRIAVDFAKISQRQIIHVKRKPREVQKLRPGFVADQSFDRPVYRRRY
jgi:hypothetical protein